MNTYYLRDYSPALDRITECKIYGHAGRPALYIPCQNGRFYDFENYRMAETLSPWIDSGKLMVLSVDTIDAETWSDKNGDPRRRIERYEQWIQFLTDEIIPFFQKHTMQANNWDEIPGVLAFGCSLGATHAANLFFRRPDIFDRLLALSGIYTAEYGFGSYMDELVYLNSPEHYMANMPPDHPYIEQYSRKKAVICTGQGAWEIPDATRRLDASLKAKGINIWVDYWGYDSVHDWDWWYKQAVYYMPYLID